jgi:hypothetical protein
LQEHHLQRALSAQQVYGTAEALVIPIPEMDIVGERYQRLYGSKNDFRVPKQYIHVQRELYVNYLLYFCSVQLDVRSHTKGLVHGMSECTKYFSADRRIDCAAPSFLMG